MNTKYILAIDQGTTGSTAILANSETFEIIASENTEYPQIYPIPSWVEHSLDDIYNSVITSINKAVLSANIKKDQIISIGITNQRETTCAYTKKGLALANAIVWQDRRTHEFCNTNQHSYEKFKETTGLPLDSYFSATKMKWLLNNNKEVANAYKENNLLFSTIDTYLLFKLSNSKSYKTDASNASRTLLMDLKTTDWSIDLLNFFGIDRELLPSIEDSFCEFGITEGLDFLPNGIRINCILGDQQSALFGQSAVNKNDLKCTYGTGAFILVNTANEIIHSKNKMLTTVAFRHRNKTSYAIEGSTYIAGAAVQWLRDNLKIIKSSSDIEELATKSSQINTEDLFFFPFFTGIAAPYWKSDIKASITGITRGTSNEDIAMVCLEGIAQSVCDSIEAIEKDLNTKISSIRVDGGASLNDLLMQLQANFSEKEIIRPKVVETTGFGVILGSAISNGQITLEDLISSNIDNRTFNPKTSEYFKNKRQYWSAFLNKL